MLVKGISGFLENSYLQISVLSDFPVEFVLYALGFDCQGFKSGFPNQSYLINAFPELGHHLRHLRLSPQVV